MVWSKLKEVLRHGDRSGGAAACFSEPARLSGLAGFKPRYAIGGIGGAAVVAVALVAAFAWRRGRGVLQVAGQLVISALADRLGWFGVARVGLTPGRLAGVLLVAVGTLLITRP